MSVSRLTFHRIPGKTGEVEKELKKLRDMVVQAGGSRPRILHSHFASLGAPNAVFEQEVPDLAILETQMMQLTATKGYAAPEVGQVHARARELCRHSGETSQLFPVLLGLWRFYLVRGELLTARELGQ
jgi:hypothetical protein